MRALKPTKHYKATAETPAKFATFQLKKSIFADILSLDFLQNLPKTSSFHQFLHKRFFGSKEAQFFLKSIINSGIVLSSEIGIWHNSKGKCLGSQNLWWTHWSPGLAWLELGGAVAHSSQQTIASLQLLATIL